MDQDQELTFLPVPKVNRFYPEPKSARALARNGMRWNALVPNRKDRRRLKKQLRKGLIIHSKA